ncbi:hypothetical protein Tco_0107718 [Tanacetum coccineum]
MNVNWNKRRIDTSILSGNNTTSDSFFIPNLKTVLFSLWPFLLLVSVSKRKYSNTSSTTDEQPNKRRCKAEKFEAIQYSLGPNEDVGKIDCNRLNNGSITVKSGSYS